MKIAPVAHLHSPVREHEVTPFAAPGSGSAVAGRRHAVARSGTDAEIDVYERGCRREVVRFRKTSYHCASPRSRRARLLTRRDRIAA